MRHLLVATTLLLMLVTVPAAALTGARAGEDWGEVWIPHWDMSLRVPTGWRLDLPLESDTARIYSPQGTEVLVRVWEGPTPLTAAEALAEYRQSLDLGDTIDPPPQRLRCTGGLEGVWVEMTLDAGDRPLLALAVFSTGTRRVALAVRGIPRYEAAARQRLEAIAASLQVAPGVAPGGPGVSPVSEAPETPVPPAPEPPVETVTSAPFTLAVARGYKVVLEQGTLWVDTPAGTGAYFLWPARGYEADLPLSEAPSAWARQAGVQLTPLMSRTAGAGTLVAATLEREEKVRALLYAWREGDSLLLTGICAPAAAWGEQAPRLAQWLAAAQCSGWRRTEPALPPTPRTWVDASGELSLRLPENFAAHDGVRVYQKQPALDLTVSGEEITLAWRQPYTPAFRDLTPILQAMGQEEGTQYREGDGEEQLLVLARRTPEKFVEWLLQRPEEGWAEAKVTRVEKSAAVAGLLPGPEKEREGAVIWVSGLREGQPREAVYLCATAPLPLEQGAFRWQAAVLSAEYPSGQAQAALAVLRAIVGGAAPVQAASDSGKVLGPAIKAAIAAAAEVTPPDAGSAPWPLLSPAYQPPAPGQAPQWTVAPGLAAWAALVENKRTAFPELAEGPWGNGIDK